MSLPPGFLDELRTRLSLSQVVGRKVMWDTRKSNQAKGDMWAPCPFHQEKSASFHVDDRKGFYYCFGCHAKGDAISFVRESENVGFMEAVEILAGEAGLQMPAKDPWAKEKADRRDRLVAVMEAAVRFYRMQFSTGAARAARSYLLKKRGLGEAAIETFEIGFAPDGWQTLCDHLAGQGVAPDLVRDAGLSRESAKGGKPYDVFRNRIMFPIRDARGRAIAFGARAMDPNDKAKYLNSPETELFDKGRNLYNLGPAREAAGKGQPLIVAEGYMDVIALSEGGFASAVAPLGTAVTEEQLQTLWRVSPEPLIALDGDAAGLRAAYRVIDLALPHLGADRSLRFALMPEGKDPDDLIRAEGPEGVRRALEAAVPTVALLWRRETDGRIFDSPERRAALDRSLRETLKRIPDPSLRYHYGEEIKRLRWELFRPAARPASGSGRAPWRTRGAPVAPAASTKASLLAQDARAEDQIREAAILAAALATPSVLAGFDTEFDAMDCTDPTHAAIREALLQSAPTTQQEAHRAVADRIGRAALDSFLAAPHLAVTPCLRHPGDVEIATLTIAEELAKMNAARGRRAAESEAVEDFESAPDEVTTWRLKQASEDYSRALRAAREDDREYDTGANGARIERGERDAFAALVDTIRFDKGRRST